MNQLGKKYIALSSVAGIASALMFISMLIFPSLFVRQIAVLISPIALAIPALAMGLNAAIIASFVGTIILFIAFGGVALMYLIVDVAPVLAITYLFIRVYENKENPTSLSIGKIISIMSLICAVLMTLFMLMFPYQQSASTMGIEAASLKDFFYQVISKSLAMPEGIDASLWEQMIETIVSYFPSALFVTWLSRAVISMIIAQWLVSSKDKMLRATPDYTQIEIPMWALIPLPFLMIATFIGGEVMNYISENALIIMLTPFLCLGLSQVHLFARRFKTFGLAILIVFYIIFFSGYGYAILIVSLLGIFEFFINQKLIKDKKIKE